jgi:hypothetical protein
VGWGHPVRSYAFDNSRLKDLRTNVEIANTQKVLDGDLEEFIQARLKQGGRDSMDHPSSFLDQANRSPDSLMASNSFRFRSMA